MEAYASELKTRSFRSTFNASRDAVMFATHPLAKVRRALQISSGAGGAPITLTPTASIRATVDRASFSTMSMSWIIMSSTTPTSMLRKVNGLIRMTSMNRGSTASLLIERIAGLNRSMCPTCPTARGALDMRAMVEGALRIVNLKRFYTTIGLSRECEVREDESVMLRYSEASALIASRCRCLEYPLRECPVPQHDNLLIAVRGLSSAQTFEISSVLPLVAALEELDHVAHARV